MSEYFFVENKGKNLVKAKFLSYAGIEILDPISERARNAHIADELGNRLVNANPKGCLIVPSNYSIPRAVYFARRIGVDRMLSLEAAIAVMCYSFRPGGPEDLQRTYPGSESASLDFVGNFTSAASFHVGFVAAYSGFGEKEALLGGGMVNLISHLDDASPESREESVSGTYWNNPKNVPCVHAGAELAKQFSDGRLWTGLAEAEEIMTVERYLPFLI